MLSSTPIKNIVSGFAREAKESDRTDIYQSVARRLLSDSTKKSANGVGLTSSSRGEGVTTVATNLAKSAARTSRRPILLVDCNIMQPRIEKVFGLAAAPGFRDVLSGRNTLTDCVRATRVPNLSILGTGGGMRGSDIAEWEHTLTEITNKFALVLFDMPPVSEIVAQSLPLDTLDGMLLVVEAERTRRKAVAHAKSQLERVGAEVLGVILNKRRNHVPAWLYNKI